MAQYVATIYNTENIGDSLIKINNNFFNLRTALCDLKQRVESTINVRTFFYYGPNAATDPASNLQDNITSRPSDNIITSFVNDSNQLNLPAISKENDVAYVIYQKTGYYQTTALRKTTGTTTARVISFATTVGFETLSPDTYNVYSPVFVIWKLTHNGTNYAVNSGFPKFTQAETISTVDWNKPENWLTY